MAAAFTIVGAYTTVVIVACIAATASATTEECIVAIAAACITVEGDSSEASVADTVASTAAEGRIAVIV